ncbi:PaaI family thioesterase [Salinisphaera aquimarina]|uniref:PaaI family thioesterase n=1 Tax=Salinisphaera aquimarina TaxID=2094031 RepID=A0ABV7EU38_9GAMM
MPELTMAQATAKYDRGFAIELGFEFLEWGPEHAVIGMQVRDKHLNLAGIIHGGILASLLDIAGSAAGSFCPYPDRIRKVITLSMTTTYTGQAGIGYIRAVARRRAGGRRIFNASVDILDADDRLLAMGEGTFRFRSGSEEVEGVAFEG